MRAWRRRTVAAWEAKENENVVIIRGSLEFRHHTGH